MHKKQNSGFIHLSSVSNWHTALEDSANVVQIKPLKYQEQKYLIKANIFSWILPLQIHHLRPSIFYASVFEMNHFQMSWKFWVRARRSSERDVLVAAGLLILEKCGIRFDHWFKGIFMLSLLLPSDSAFRFLLIHSSAQTLSMCCLVCHSVVYLSVEWFKHDSGNTLHAF